MKIFQTEIVKFKNIACTCLALVRAPRVHRGSPSPVGRLPVLVVLVVMVLVVMVVLGPMTLCGGNNRLLVNINDRK